MLFKKNWQCEICKKEYDEKKLAKKCESDHKICKECGGYHLTFEEVKECLEKNVELKIQGVVIKHDRIVGIGMEWITLTEVIPSEISLRFNDGRTFMYKLI